MKAKGIILLWAALAALPAKGQEYPAREIRSI
jgi:hypothetical protein